ncbi:MAG: dehydrogenase [Verrucomicrobia bacterium]|nr:dehydrogenase [Verrucomicrobiota bacterium]
MPKPPPSPALSPEEALKTFQLPDGFRIELAASDPMVQDPIAIAFDEDGRLWVVEMRGFMPTIDRDGELDETGRISLLEDADQDGRFEKATVFVDKLVLPRAVAALNGGILFVSASKLWFADDKDADGKADRTVLVDPNYGGGNLEHAPNGLMRALDNWVYNAKSQYRYRLVDGLWIKQRTEFRGQWGIAQDNYGRLVYNVNYSQLLGDVAPPNYMGRNSHHKTAAGLNLAISTNQQVFPIRMNTAVNRGYRTNILDRTGRLREFASSCSPLIYRGDNLPEEFQGNAFVCDPSANLIKRNIVFNQGLALTSKFAYENSEFLASTDERFRPVNVFNGPDGALWIVDMYRGIVQHGAFMTSYLRRESLERGLDKPINLGRIYRVVTLDKTPEKSPKLSRESDAWLVQRLSHPNGWIRDAAQRLLVERRGRSVVPELVQVALNDPNHLGRIHALWTLEGLFAELPKRAAKANSEIGVRLLTSGATDSNLEARATDLEAPPLLMDAAKEFVLEAPGLSLEVFRSLLKSLDDPHPKVQVAAIRVLESLCGSVPERQGRLLHALNGLANRSTLEVLFQLVLTLGNLHHGSPANVGHASSLPFQDASLPRDSGGRTRPDVLDVLAEAAARAAENALLRDAVLSGLQDWELQFLLRLFADPRWERRQAGRDALLHSLASAIVKERRPEKVIALLDLAAHQKPAQAWRQKSLLDGIAANAQSRSFEPIPLAAAPTAFASLVGSNDSKRREQIDRIKNLFAWPGHEPKPPDSRRTSGRPLTQREEVALHEGKVYYQQLCAGCHGFNGEGIEPVAPPLANSEWVVGPESRLIRIVLQGLEGPIHVNDSRYESPLVLPEMPAVTGADDFTITGILNYIRRDWGHEVDPLSLGMVSKVRRETANRELQWTEEELLQIK